MDFWCSEHLVVTVDGPGGRALVSLEKPFALVGGHPSADVVIPGPEVAQRALYVHAAQGGVYCLFLDVASASPEEKGRWLSADESVAVGDYSIKVNVHPAEEGPAAPAGDLAAKGSATPPLPLLLAYCGDLLKDKRRIRSRLSLVGRRPQCGLQLKGKKVSSFHCVLYWDGGKLWCVDLKSSNGTTISGRPIDCAEVEIGDRVEVGEFGLVFQRLSRGGGQSRGQSAPASGESPSAAATERVPDSAEQSRWNELRAAEAAQLASQREAMQAHWEATNQQLARQVAALQEQAAELARERGELARARGELQDERNRFQAERDAATKRLEARIETLQAELAESADQRQVLEGSRQEWLAQRQALTTELTTRDEQLARLESDLAVATSQLARSPADADVRKGDASRPLVNEPIEQPEEPAGFPQVDAPAPEAAALTDVSESAISPEPAEWELESWLNAPAESPRPLSDMAPSDMAPSEAIAPPAIAQPSETSVATGGPPAPLATPPAPAAVGRREVSDSEQLTLLVSSRVGEKYATPSRRWLWWSAGGLAVAVLLAGIAVGVMWAW